MEKGNVAWTHPRGLGLSRGYCLRQIPSKPHLRCPSTGSGLVHAVRNSLMGHCLAGPKGSFLKDPRLVLEV
ncbi:hypothetical protein KY290_021144 [Solanum tuberosum]|uniref:Uncharacterized protein n=1 Tax=Solanum tuberosum TaxID=4113 RepID=A0ABQ7V0S6_SOLTU|nr:hypothetical protein KY289_020319 [Solanum tuberosum]KAH0692978.1 hypothetical protein KY285_020075 [Solanum tuberosum]KAH0757651.1 hypothetical protein KY290_021144 [Solanum tuberosum]